MVPFSGGYKNNRMSEGEKKTQFLYFILLDPCNDKAAGNICLICSLAYWKAPGDISAGDLLEKCRMKLPPGLLGRRPAPQLAWVRIASTPYTDDWRDYWGGGRLRLSCVTCTMKNFKVRFVLLQDLLWSHSVCTGVASARWQEKSMLQSQNSYQMLWRCWLILLVSHIHECC